MTATAIWWIRRDLRLTDNQSLAYALAHARQVIPVFVFDPGLFDSPYASSKRLAFLLGGLRQLDADLRARGSYLVIRQGRPIDELAALMAEGQMDLAGTSQLSPYLRFGMLSARQAVVRALEVSEIAPDPEARQGATTWLNELIWREFYIAILYHFPQVRQRSFRPIYDSVPWDNDLEAFAAWCEGRTGFPVVDAAMRQLVQTGWMHNRARMIVSSFLVKDLLIDWRWGERFFMQHLIDGDPAANNGGWQWTAGTGTDAAPYFRIFNPILQGQRFDPDGVYIRRWVPELAVVPDKHIHTPWKMPEHVQRQAVCRIGQDYPRPMVDHKWARARTLAAYKQSRAGSLGLT